MSWAVLSVVSTLVKEEVISIFEYPVWWYTKGFRALLRWVEEGLVYRWKSYAISLWFRHITVPMYGEYSILGRAVSLVMRVVVIIARSIAWTVEAIIYGLFIVLWLVWPIAAALGLAAALLTQGLPSLV